MDVTRGGRVESRHRGTLVLLDAGGAVSVAVGDVDEPVFARSSLKPLQAVALVDNGFAQPPAALALACASHDGAEVHRDGVRAVLAAAGTDERPLRCPADLPMGAVASAEYVAAGGRPAAICHNCSGKHAAMVATCVANGWDVETYLDPRHPVQTAVQRTIEQLCGEPIVATSVDGCGAPAHAVRLGGLARAFATIAADARTPAGGTSSGTSRASVRAAMRAHPVLVGGVGRAVTDLIADVDGLVVKDGAEGVWAGALADGRAFAVKIADGASRALPVVVATVLASWGIDCPGVRQWATSPVLGGGAPVGELHASAGLLAALG